MESEISLSTAELKKNGGYLTSNGEINGVIFKEKETLDKNGEVVHSIYCYSDMECDMRDENTWFVDELVDVYKIDIVGGSLEYGVYFCLFRY